MKFREDIKIFTLAKNIKYSETHKIKVQIQRNPSQVHNELVLSIIGKSQYVKIIFFSFTVRFIPPNRQQGFASFWFPRWIKGLLPALRKSLAFSHVNFSECFVEGKNLFRNDSEQYKKLVCADAADFQCSSKHLQF